MRYMLGLWILSAIGCASTGGTSIPIVEPEAIAYAAGYQVGATMAAECDSASVWPVLSQFTAGITAGAEGCD